MTLSDKLLVGAPDWLLRVDLPGVPVNWPHREGGPHDQARVAFDRMPQETKQALYNGDLDLDDALDDELGISARHQLSKLIERWGDHAQV